MFAAALNCPLPPSRISSLLSLVEQIEVAVGLAPGEPGQQVDVELRQGEQMHVLHETAREACSGEQGGAGRCKGPSRRGEQGRGIKQARQGRGVSGGSSLSDVLARPPQAGSSKAGAQPTAAAQSAQQTYLQVVRAGGADLPAARHLPAQSTSITYNQLTSRLCGLVALTLEPSATCWPSRLAESTSSICPTCVYPHLRSERKGAVRHRMIKMLLQAAEADYKPVCSRAAAAAAAAAAPGCEPAAGTMPAQASVPYLLACACASLAGEAQPGEEAAGGVVEPGKGAARARVHVGKDVEIQLVGQEGEQLHPEAAAGEGKWEWAGQ